MLRTARSLPTLRVLESTISKDIQQQTKNFSTISSKYNLVVPNIPDHQLSTKYQTLNRSVHQSSKNNATTLFSNKNSEFSVMSLNSLKNECRKRGLKISGKKAELVSRITTHEKTFATQQVGSISTKASSKIPPKEATKKSLVNKISKTFSTTTTKNAKGDDSTIDFIKPVDISQPKLVEDDYIVQIPSLSSEASATPVTKLEKQLNQSSTSDPNAKIVSKAEGSDSKIFEQSSINKIEEQNEEALKTDASKIVQEPAFVDEPYKYEEGEVSSKDKSFFAGALAVVAGWWVLKPKSEKKH